MRNMSFALTVRQMRAKTKDVTRRTGWTFLKPGDRIQACVKCMGLKPGESLVRLGEIEVVSVQRERLDRLTTDLEYGFDELKREGFGDHAVFKWPSAFVEMFCGAHKGCTPQNVITRIEFRHL